MFYRSLSYLKCRCQGTNTSCSLNFLLLTLSSPYIYCQNAQTYISPTPPIRVTLTISLMALILCSSVEKWWTTAIEIKASQVSERRGRERLSAEKSWQDSAFYWAVLRRPIERSVPSMQRDGLTPMYFPFPHPTSQTVEPASSSFKNFYIFGQGLQRVCEKCGAILSQTSQTCFFWSSSGSDLSSSPPSSIFGCFVASS